MKDEEAIKKLKQMISLNQFIIINQPTDVEGNKDLNDEIKAMNYVLNLIEKKDLEITSLKMEHDYDVKMIDEVKGEAVKLYKEIETLKRDFEIVDHECNRLEQENIKKDKQIEQYINMLATNDMLHVLECEKKDKIIDEMAEYIDEITEEIAREKGVEDFEFCDNKCTDKDEYIECKQCIKEYFKNKAKESK